MANQVKAKLNELIRGFSSAIDEQSVRKIGQLDKQVQVLLSDPSLDRKMHQDQLEKLKKVHEQAFAFVRNKSSEVQSRRDSLSDNQDGLRGYFEVMNQV